MKKSIFLVSATILFALLLAACGEGATTDGTTTPGAFGDDQGLGTPSGTTDLGDTADPTDELGAATTPTKPVGPETTPAKTAEATRPAGTPVVGATAAMTGTVGTEVTRLDAGRLNDLLDFEVHSPDHDVIGDINDIILDLDTGEASYIIVGVGGFLGIGEKDVAIPCSLFEFPAATSTSGTGSTGDADTAVTNDNFLILNVDEAALENAPDFDAEALPELGEPADDYDMEWNEYWSQYGSTQGSASGQSDDSMNQPLSGKLQGVLLARDVIGYNINTSTGDTIGEVTDVIIDTTNCQVLYVVISYDGADGDVLVPVPPAAFQLDVEGNAFVVADADTTLADAPFYTDVDFPFTLDADWDDDIRSYWETHISPNP